jgi:hypothetical protein
MILPGVFSDFWKKIWKLNLNDRSRFFLWKILWNILPTRERVNSIFSSLDSLSNCSCVITGRTPYLIFFLGVVLRKFSANFPLGHWIWRCFIFRPWWIGLRSFFLRTNFCRSLKQIFTISKFLRMWLVIFYGPIEIRLITKVLPLML